MDHGHQKAYFELSRGELVSRQSAKWFGRAEGIIPSPVAEMDFSVAPAIRAAVMRIVETDDYGYPKRMGFERPEQSLAQAFAGRMERLYGWQPDPALVQPLADLVQASYATFQAFSDPGDGIILMVPAYSPFFRAIAETGRTLLPLQLFSDGTRHVVDIAELEALAGRARILALCNPQNPTGRVFSRAELEEFGRIAVEHDLIIVSDEIHAELVFDDNRHIPIASLSPEIARRTVTLNSPTKSFNIPGLRAAVMHFGVPELKARFEERIPSRLLGQVNAVGIDAAVAAWDGRSDEWLADVHAHLLRMRNRITATLAAELPDIRCHAPEGTYLAWLDCSELGLNIPAGEFFHQRAGIYFSPGENFDPERQSCVRMNFAASSETIEEILDCMVRAVKSLGR